MLSSVESEPSDAVVLQQLSSGKVVMRTCLSCILICGALPRTLQANANDMSGSAGWQGKIRQLHEQNGPSCL